jgi:amidophosphoribosyltransferase
MPGPWGFGVEFSPDQLRRNRGLYSLSHGTSADRGGAFDGLELSLWNHQGRRELAEKCGVVGVANVKDAVGMAVDGLINLQHRGEQGAGVAWLTPEGLKLHRGEGPVAQAFSSFTVADASGARVAIGHTRYATTGGQGIQNVQPFMLRIPVFGEVAIAHNGNLTNAHELRAGLEREGCTFSSTSDTEVVLHLMARAAANCRNKVELLSCALKQVTGSYSIIAIFPDGLLAARDPHGNRPLSIGRLGDATIVTSESCGWDSLGVDRFEDVPPGVVVEIGSNGHVSAPHPTLGKILSAQCLMELLYFSRPDSIVFDVPVHEFRRKMGRMLYERHPVQADFVIPLMSSGLHFAEGFAAASGIPMAHLLIKNPTSARVFTSADPLSRAKKTRLKHNVIREAINGKKLVVVDDSLVRGDTISGVVKHMYRSEERGLKGATEVHVRIAAPPIVGPCHYGISTPNPNELAANKWGGYTGTGALDPVRIAEALCRAFGATSLEFGTLDDVGAALGGAEFDDFCTACFTGQYDKIPGPLYRLA